MRLLIPHSLWISSPLLSPTLETVVNRKNAPDGLAELFDGAPLFTSDPGNDDDWRTASPRSALTSPPSAPYLAIFGRNCDKNSNIMSDVCHLEVGGDASHSHASPEKAQKR